MTRLHRALGDFWFHSFVLFVAFRAADLLNMATTLYLVPRYVASHELGAVMPLTNFATFLAVPVFAFAMALSKEVNALAQTGDHGRLKTLIRGVFLVIGGLLALVLLLAYLTLPRFCAHMRITCDVGAFLAIAFAFVGCASPVYTNVLQGLKRFGALAAVTALGAPFRLGVMALLMPLRAVAGYFAGLCAQPAALMAFSVVALRRELSVPAEPYWTLSIVRNLARLFCAITLYQIAGMGLGLVEQSALRLVLCDADSAGYFMMSRFADISSYVSSALVFTIFPYAAECSSEHHPTRPLVLKASCAALAFSALLAGVFALFGRSLVLFVPHGQDFAAYAPYIPALIGISTLGALQVFYTNAEVAAGRFAFLAWWLPFHLIFASLFYLTAAQGTIHTLGGFLIWIAAGEAVKLIFCATGLMRQRPAVRHTEPASPNRA